MRLRASWPRRTSRCGNEAGTLPRSLDKLTLLVVVTALAGCGGGPAGRASDGAATEPIARIAATSVDQAVAFRLININFDTIEAAEGSAFFASADGLAVTCAHVVDGATPLAAVLRDGRRADVEVVFSDHASDLTLHRVEGGGQFPFLTLGERDAVAGERVWTVTKDGLGEGWVKGPFVDQVVGDALKLFTSLGLGGSGGAVVCADGRLIGVVRGVAPWTTTRGRPS